ncbi:MAG: class I SAM-dependent methyltransferase [Candidatus Magasanikbacteria bacterium]|jgi:ubiquinone/menaquinone biosynthesis C-methylase UbiE
MDQQTIDAYNLSAKNYDDQTVDFWDKFPRTFLDKFIGLVGKNILDIGSGPGRDAVILREKGLSVTCLDASESMIKFCLEKGFESVLGDFNNLPFSENMFDGVWAYTSLLHVKKAEIIKPIQEIYRVLKPNGIFGLGMIEGETEEYRENTKISTPRWFSFYKKEEIEELLKQNKFEIIYFEIFKPSTKNYLNFIARKV